MARRAKKWRAAIIDCRGCPKQRLIHVRQVLWYRACPSQPVLLVIVRDPAGNEPDDFFFTTDLQAYGPDIAGQYAGRWAIEDTFRSVKQSLMGEDPQTWKGQGPERAAALSLWIYAAVWQWYIKTQGARPRFLRTPWYPGKSTPSFADALAALRRALWRRRIFARCDSGPLPHKFAVVLIDALAEAT